MNDRVTVESSPGHTSAGLADLDLPREVRLRLDIPIDRERKPNNRQPVNTAMLDPISPRPRNDPSVCPCAVNEADPSNRLPQSRLEGKNPGQRDPLQSQVKAILSRIVAVGSPPELPVEWAVRRGHL